ncbi:MAG: DUF2272 domain-containing protein [Gammaproteobacteria bacterium]|nr:DUF2272 domain-containing protein [Gammaproteobacteria bacterium]
MSIYTAQNQNLAGKDEAQVWHEHQNEELTSVALPGSDIKQIMTAGDRLVRTVPYEGIQQSSVIVSDHLESITELAARGIPLESNRPGGYVEVLEEMTDGQIQPFGRRVTDSAGRLLSGQKLLRPGELFMPHRQQEEFAPKQYIQEQYAQEEYRQEEYTQNKQLDENVNLYDEGLYEDDLQTESQIYDNQLTIREPAELSTNQINWCTMRQTIAATARAEEVRWTAANGNKYQESNHPNRNQILTSYWLTVPGFTNQAAAAARATQSINNQVAWSAAFVCYVMHMAGIRQVNGFEFSQRHITYIVGALRNRERSSQSRPFWLVDDVELVNEATPQPGDIMCFNRSVNGRMTTHNYSSLRRSYWSNGRQNVNPTGSSHTSIVVGTTVHNGQRFLETIGGNENHSVRIRRIPIDQYGGIPNPAAQNIFGMIKITRC